MRTALVSFVAASTLILSSVAGGQAPLSTDTHGYLDFIGAKAGAPKVSGTGILTGPYNAKFGTNAANAASKTAFDVYCFDWMANAGDGKVAILTFSDLVNKNGAVATALYNKITGSAGASNTLTLGTLNSAAWLANSMSVGAQSLWDEKHVALWNLFWKDGVGNPVLPGEGSYTGAQTWYNQAVANSGFDGSSYRIFAPVDAQGNFVTNRQVFMGQVTQVPEPTSLALVVVGLVSLGSAARRRRA